MTQSRKTWLALALAAGGAATAFVPGTANAQAPPAVTPAAGPNNEIGILGTCGDHFAPVVAGGRASWDVICRWSGSQWFVYLDGWVADTAVDGKCAWVRGERFPGDPNTQYARNCMPGGPRTDFVFKFDGRNADGYLYTS